MVLDDLGALPDSPLVVAEGSAIPAHAVSNSVADRSRAVWLIPTREFQDGVLAAQAQSPGPKALYRLLRDVISGDANEHGALTLVVDGSGDVQVTVAAVEELFMDALVRGPRARTTDERRALLREMNMAVASQVRSYYTRPWAKGDAESVVREFSCECGDTSCADTVDVRVGAVATAPVFAPGHR